MFRPDLFCAVFSWKYCVIKELKLFYLWIAPCLSCKMYCFTYKESNFSVAPSADHGLCCVCRWLIVICSASQLSGVCHHHGYLPHPAGHHRHSHQALSRCRYYYVSWRRRKLPRVFRHWTVHRWTCSVAHQQQLQGRNIFIYYCVVYRCELLET